MAVSKKVILDETEISKLPNVLELQDLLVDINANTPTPFIYEDAFINDAQDSNFIVNRVLSGRYNLKTNLRNRRFLYRGQNAVYDKIVSSFARKKTRAERIISNMKFADFAYLLRSHPISILLEKGIYLKPNLKFIFEMNYYGLGQHYGFNTGLIDLTSDIDTAVFFATTVNLGFDVYKPISDTNKYKYGVIYTHRINPSTFKSKPSKEYFSTIGKQIFPRSGAQNGFLYQENGALDCTMDKHVSAWLFRHDAEISKRIFDNTGIEKYFPTDDIALFAKEILESKTVTGQSFMQNLYDNPQDKANDIMATIKRTVDIDWHKKYKFDNNKLAGFFKDPIKFWEEFCKDVCFVGRNGEELLESLYNIPKTKEYEHFFTPEGFEKISIVDRKY